MNSKTCHCGREKLRCLYLCVDCAFELSDQLTACHTKHIVKPTEHEARFEEQIDKALDRD